MPAGIPFALRKSTCWTRGNEYDTPSFVLNSYFDCNIRKKPAESRRGLKALPTKPQRCVMLVVPITVLIQFTDFNRADRAIVQTHRQSWKQLEGVLREMPLHLKASDQAGIQGNPIFDPVGTNEHIKTELLKVGWGASIPIPAEYNFLGTDVDFGVGGLLVEVQFSNYPFLLNNTIRSELFFKARLLLGGHRTTAAVIITKAQMFPASNSTLYYEQALRQLTALAKNHVFDVPIRLVGLFEKTGAEIEVCYTEYGARYSRAVGSRTKRVCLINPGGRSRSRLQLT